MNIGKPILLRITLGWHGRYRHGSSERGLNTFPAAEATVINNNTPVGKIISHGGGLCLESWREQNH